MPLSIRIARSGRDRDAAYRLRGLSAGEGGSAPRGVTLDLGPLAHRPAMPIDRFDAFPTTRLLMGTVDDRCIATLRVSIDGAAGTPLGEQDLAPEDCIIDAIAVARDHRDRRSLFFNLLKMAVRVSRPVGAVSSGKIYVKAPAWCAQELGEIGFNPYIGEGQAGDRLYVMPRAELRPSFLESENKQIDRFTQGLHRSIYRAGDSIFRRNDVADGLFVVARGSVRLQGVMADGAAVDVARLGPGDILGEEICSGDGARRWVDAYADSPETDLYYMDKTSLERSLRQDPDLGDDLRRLLGERIQHMTAQLLGRERPAAISRMVSILKAQAEQMISSGVRPPFELPACTPRWLASQSACTEASARLLLQILYPAIEQRGDRVWVVIPSQLSEIDYLSEVFDVDGISSARHLRRGSLSLISSSGAS